MRITNNGYESDEADIIDRLPPYPNSSTKTNLTKRDLLMLAQIDNSKLTNDEIRRLHEIIWTYKSCFYKYSGTSGLYKNPEKLELITIPHNIPKPMRTPRYTPEKEREIEVQINNMLKNNMIEPSRTPYLSRINLVKKKDNNWRFVVDFRAINKLIQPQSHHILRIDSILDKASGKQFYTSLDLKNGFHQLLLDKSSRYLTDFPTHMGIFQYKKIPMGLVGSPDFFNYVMETVFGNNNNFAYFDDILLTDNTIHDHMSNIPPQILVYGSQYRGGETC
uniref:Reverse transcriptase domain-containing protein n=1 Tax=Strongyloides stercoralis TaxID=6248 RepID=A0A0K0E077_STRER